MASTQSAPISLPRVAITYCTQCRWMLRAAYFGQELLSTFGTRIGEIALIPATGGLFIVELTYIPPNQSTEDEYVEAKKALLWDRKVEGGFPETKVLKQRVRDFIDPGRDLGHSDKGGKKKIEEEKKEEEGVTEEKGEEGKQEKGEKDEGGKLNVGKDNEGVELKRNSDGTLCEDCA